MNTTKKYTDEEMLNYIRSFYDAHGRVPKSKECLKKNGLPSPMAFVRRWGSFNQAMVAAGFIPHPMGDMPIPREIALRQFNSLAQKLGRSPLSTDLDGKHDLYLPNYTTYRKYFGTISNVRCEAGLEPVPIRIRGNRYTDDEAILLIRKRASEKSKIPTITDYELASGRGYPSTSALKRYFGSWSEAKKHAFPNGTLVRVRFSFLPVRLYLGLYRLAKRLRLIRVVESHLTKQ